MRKINQEEFSIYSKSVRQALLDNKSWRAGQALFNVLDDQHTDIANEIRGSVFDPFYDNSVIVAFLEEICDEAATNDINPVLKIFSLLK